MKDAKGHGSDARGMASAATAGNHQAGVLRVGRPGYRVQRSAGQGLWKTTNVIGGRSKSVIAENVARFMRADNRNAANVPTRVVGIRSTI